VFVSVETSGVVTVVRVDRPPANAISVELLDELVGALEGLAVEVPAAVVIAGRVGFFSAGVDLKAVPEYGPDEQRRMVDGINRMVLATYRLVLSSELIDGSEALRLGLVDEALEPDAVLPRAVELATETAAFPVDVYAATKRELRSRSLGAIKAAVESEPLLESWLGADR
jgi:enoyl-CoA hydratase/carnithine racemase